MRNRTIENSSLKQNLIRPALMSPTFIDSSSMNESAMDESAMDESALNERLRIERGDKKGFTSKLSFALVFILLFITAPVRGELLQDTFRFGAYGLVAGALAGGTLLALSEDPSSGLEPVARGASLGLYSGLFVALYQNWKPNDSRRFHVFPVAFRSPEGATNYEVLFQKTF